MLSSALSNKWMRLICSLWAPLRAGATFITEFMADFFLFLTEVIFSILIPSGFLLAILSNCIQNSLVSEGLFQINAGETIYQYGVPWLSLDMLIGSLGNDDGDVNESCKKAMGLNWQNNNFTRASRFFVHFFAVTTRLRRENAQIHVLWRTWTQLDNDFLFLFLNSETVLLELNFRNNCQHLKNWPRWNKRDKVWRSANSLFNWRFRTVVVVAAFPNLNNAVVFFLIFGPWFTMFWTIFPGFDSRLSSLLSSDSLSV